MSSKTTYAGVTGSPRSELVGREKALDEIRSRVESGVPCSTVIGPPGVGKTVLVRRVAASLNESEDFGGSLSYCDLGGAESRADVISALGGTLPLETNRGADPEEALAQLVDWLAQRDVVLVLDHVEHVREILGDLVSEVFVDRGLQVIVASREPLDVECEELYRLDSLELDDAVDLFEAVAGEQTVDGGDLRELLEQLDCLPLAVEVVAAQLPAMGPSQVLESSQQHIDILLAESPESGRWESPLRQAIEWSWSHLQDWERSALEQASLFQGAFTLQAARAVVSLEEFDDAPPVAQALNSLVRKSLVRDEHGGSQVRAFCLYRSVAEFVRSAGESALRQARERHGRYFVGRAERLVEMTETAENRHALEEFELSRADLNAAFEWLLDSRPVAAARIAVSATHLAVLSAPQQASEAGIDRALSALDEEDGVRVEEGSGAGDDERRRVRARLHAAKSSAWMRAYAPRTEGVGRNLERALEIVDPDLDRRLYAELQAHYGRFAGSVGRVEKAYERLDEAISIAEELGAADVRITGLANRSVFRIRAGELERARGDLSEAVALAASAELPRLGGLAHNLFTIVEMSADRLERGISHAEEALSDAEQVGVTVEALNARTTIGIGEIALGRLDAAERALERGLEIAEETDHPTHARALRMHLGTIDTLRFDLERAAERFDRCIGATRAQRRPVPEVDAYCRLAAARFLGGEVEAGRESLDEARRVAEEVDSDRGRLLVRVAEDYHPMGEALEALEGGEVVRARRLLDEVEPAVPSASEETSVDPSKAYRIHVAVRIQRLALERLREERSALSASDRSADVYVEIGADAEWFEGPDGERVDLSQRLPLRRLLAHLAGLRADAPGSGADAFELMEVGWPDETLVPESGKARVYTAIGSLRDLGLEGVLLTGDEGYLLDPEIPLYFHSG